MDISRLDWHALDRLRDGFIGGAAARGPYWQTAADLANYDATYGERIGWKLDHVLAELRQRRWTPRARTVIDWGCGSGIAGRRVVGALGIENFDTLNAWDHSPLARAFAADAARRAFPLLNVADAAPENTDAPFLLVASHVINELSPPARDSLLALARRADAIIWVEPGTHTDSRALVSVREAFRADFQVVAPCPHQSACGLLAAGAERHWCHFFAPPPAGIYADSDWVKFGQRAGIDLRSLPYSFLVLEKKGARASSAMPPLPPGTSRIIGRPRFHKAHATLCNCDEAGIAELALPKRADPAFFKTLERDPPHPPLHRWEREGDRITAVEPALPLPPG
ncbi:small ribosomal subunit Rsm22 family protein [Termitidicoccus mucosus]|uniref:Ribosomal small subunit Rsm22 n=1 Tax=Termitidicoccus mucosus TaxID=1184151 RepID=A0A178ID23_9BACT|nr:hypothetical protein AW736_20030 [Opitutaceae bacterium TSB47]